MAINRKKWDDLKEACVQAAREVIAESGVEGLSLRDVARKLEISHQAPYRHFGSRDELLAEIMRRCFADFAEHLEQSETRASPGLDLRALGDEYLRYAAQKPLEYRLMFGTPWPEAARHPELLQQAVRAFNILRDNLRRKHAVGDAGRHQADLDALFIWSALHGMASITQANVMQHLQLAQGVMPDFKEDMMKKIDLALNPQPHPVPAVKGAKRKARA